MNAVSLLSFTVSISGVETPMTGVSRIGMRICDVWMAYTKLGTTTFVSPT